jgi:dolichol-phosphate mannosyltransferase
MKPFVVLPTYDEAKNIKTLIQRILELQPTFGIIIVDDNSPDGTGKIADDLARADSRIIVIHRPRKAGLGTAYIEGFKLALAQGADLIFEMDADFSHDPIYLADFVKAADSADLVIGSRYSNGVRVEGWRFRRLLLSKFANIFVSYVMLKPTWDFTAGFRCYRRKVIESIGLDNIRSDGYAFQIEMTYLTYQRGFKVVEIPIVFKARKHGTSKISRNVVREAFWITLRCHAPVFQIFRHLPNLFKDYDENAGEAAGDGEQTES